MAVHVDSSAPLRRVTVSDYFRMGEAGVIAEGERVELLRGAVVEMAPPTPDHDWVVEWLNMRLVPLAIEAGLSSFSADERQIRRHRAAQLLRRSTSPSTSSNSPLRSSSSSLRM
jgi:hypothetical protein